MLHPTLTPDKPRPLLIVGRAPNAADLALRRILHAKATTQALCVMDYQGSLAGVLTPRNKGNLHKAPVLWCDLGNRRRPSALFRFKQSPGMRQALRAFLLACVKHLALNVSVPTVDAVVELAWRLADQGSIGLAALLRALRRPELAAPTRRATACGAEVDLLIDNLDWLLRFPSVWALSEGNNQVDLHRAMARGETVWLEMPGAHLERTEQLVMAWMIDAALLDCLLSSTDAEGSRKTPRPPPLLLYGFAPAAPLPMTLPALDAKQVGVFMVDEAHPLPGPARLWVQACADCWVAGDVGTLSARATAGWLDDAERTRLASLERGQVWVRSGASHKAVTMLVRPPDDSRILPQGLRRMAAKRLRLSPVKQFAAAITRDEAQPPPNADLYAMLCNKATLYAGWFRVKTHNRKSYGHDRVTIEQFGSALDAELDRLASELTEGRYRSRPLRTVRIPKSDGDLRLIRIACVRDRVVQAACLHLLEPLFEARFSPASFAYRPGRGAHHAVALARAAISAGKHYAVTADIRKCFDSVDHDILLRLVSDVVGDRDIIQLLRGWLTGDVIDFMEISPSELGVPQGEAISPLLANIYLDPMDKEFEKAGVTFVRYADDYLVLCETEAEARAQLRMMGEFLQGALRLALKPEKTQTAHLAHGVAFLGFEIELADARLPADRIARTLATVGEYLDALTCASVHPQEMWRTATRLNSLVRGFRNYYLIDAAPAIRGQLAAMDTSVNALAGQRMKADAALNLVWGARERFLPGDGEASENTGGAADAAAITGGYIHGDALDAIAHPNRPEEVTTETTTRTHGGAHQAAPINLGQEGDADVLRVDSRVHVMTSGCFVTAQAADLVVRKRKAEVFRTPLAEMTMLYLEGKAITISSDLTMQLCEQGIPVVFTPLVGIPAAIAQPVQSLRSNVRQQQVLRRNDPTMLKSGLRMLAAKVANQASVLKYFARYRKRNDPAAYGELTRTADTLRGIAATLDTLDPTAAGARATGMGHEGRAAALYWSAISGLVPSEMAFPGRHTRHATDPVNSAINYVYGVLYGEVWRAIIRAGLDPYFGIIHGTERDQGSLVFDVIEEYRAPFGDRLVIGMLGRGFSLALDKDGLLRATCRRKLVQAFHKQWQRAVRHQGKMRRVSEVLEAQVTSLKNDFMGKDEYRPFRFQW